MTVQFSSLNTQRVKVVLCGYGCLGLSLLRALLNCPQYCSVTGVFRWVSIIGKESYWEPVEKEFQDLVQQARLFDIINEGVNSYAFTELLERLKPDVLLFGSWGEIIKPHILNKDGLHVINCHPSKLPAHQGANPYASVILNDESETGVTFHKMVSQIDAGDILLQQTIKILPVYTGDTLRRLCAECAEGMIEPLLKKFYHHIFDQHPLQAIPQDALLQSYFPQLKSEDGLLDWQENNTVMFRRMRALFPWIVTYAIVQEIQWLKLSIKVLFFAPSFQPVLDNDTRTETPGCIIKRSKQKLFIALNDDSHRLEVHQYRISMNRWLLPDFLNELVGSCLLRPGKQLQGKPHCYRPKALQTKNRH